jgi:hypothetical protein
MFLVKILSKILKSNSSIYFLKSLQIFISIISFLVIFFLQFLSQFFINSSLNLTGLDKSFDKEVHIFFGAIK